MEKIKIGIGITAVAFMGIVVGWTWRDYTMTCPGDQLCTLERADANPAEIAKYCEAFVPQQVPEIVTEYVPQYIKTKCPECDCADLISKAWQECIKGYEEFQPAPAEKCVGLCPVKIYRGSNS